MRLITSDEAIVTTVQHVTPCSDCPWRRDAIRGWLGGTRPKTFIRLALGDEAYPCHAFKGPQCAGMAIFRGNIAKLPRDPRVLRLPADRRGVFATAGEFLEHHSR